MYRNEYTELKGVGWDVVDRQMCSWFSQERTIERNSNRGQKGTRRQRVTGTGTVQRVK